jgi:transposase-like protein
MPWKEASPMDERTQFIADYLRDVLSISELCAMYGITRKAGYKWIDRYLRQGPVGLEERSRRSPKPDVGRDRCRDPRRPASTSDLGRQEAVGAVGRARLVG